TYLATATIDPAATGTLDNTATVSDPSDPIGANNIDDDVDTLTPKADLAITKDDGQPTAFPGSQVTYTITVTNNGPSDAVGATVLDVFPAAVTAATWTCTPTPGDGTDCHSGSGDLSDSADLPAGTSVTYLATVDIDPLATGDLDNTATVAPPAGVVDDLLTNNTDSDVDVLLIEADLVLTKDNGVVTVIPGGPVTYTITVTNNGPGDVVGATVIDILSPLLEGASWSCVAAPAGSCGSGSDNIADTITLPSGSTATYTLTASLVPTANGNLNNTAQVDPPVTVYDPQPANNNATDGDLIARQADLEVTKHAVPTSFIQGNPIVYTITVANNGPSNTTGVRVTDAFPSEVTGVNWTCSASSGASCPAGGAGDIDVLVDLDSGSQVTFTATATASVAPPATITNTAVVTEESGVGDPDGSNNSATALNPVGIPIFADGFESGDVSAWSSSVGGS
ncbi:MAG: DUF11 domain-containing protein, partial [bacterium]|nr:DUF11 domain-containing protein [bacterium]